MPHYQRQKLKAVSKSKDLHFIWSSLFKFSTTCQIIRIFSLQRPELFRKRITQSKGLDKWKSWDQVKYRIGDSLMRIRDLYEVNLDEGICKRLLRFFLILFGVTALFSNGDVG